LRILKAEGRRGNIECPISNGEVNYACGGEVCHTARRVNILGSSPQCFALLRFAKQDMGGLRCASTLRYEKSPVGSTGPL
jgi:hypothetical protein